MAVGPAGGMTRWLVPVLAVLALVLVALGVVAWLTAPGGTADLVLVEVSGEVQIRGEDGPPTRAGAGLVVGQGEQVRTGQGGTAVLSAGDDTEIRVEPSSSLLVRGVQDDVVRVEVDGRVRADVRGGRRTLEVASGDRAVRTRDGTFAVAASGGIFAVEVERGAVATEGLGEPGQLTAGSARTALPDGTVAMGDIPDAVLVDVAWPTERRTRASTTTVRGTTSPGATVTLTGGVSPVSVVADADGRFEVEVALREGQHPVVVEVIDPFGRRVSDGVALERDTTPPTLRGGTVEER